MKAETFLGFCIATTVWELMAVAGDDMGSMLMVLAPSPQVSLFAAD